MRDGRLVNDLDVRLPRPRDEDVRASNEAVGLQKEILRHLGFDATERDEGAQTLRTGTVG
jgi:hypothetical protein